MQRDANVQGFFVCVGGVFFLFLHRQESHDQGFSALPEYHPGGPAERRGPGQAEQLKE